MKKKDEGGKYLVTIGALLGIVSLLPTQVSLIVFITSVILSVYFILDN